MNESIDKKEEEESNINNECNDEYSKDVKHCILLHADDSSNIVHRMKQNIEGKEKEKRNFSKEKEDARIKKLRENERAKRVLQKL